MQQMHETLSALMLCMTVFVLLQRVCWYSGTKHLAVLRACFETHTFSISHTPYSTPSATDEAVERGGLQR
jgi:hypothetical protein